MRDQGSDTQAKPDPEPVIASPMEQLEQAFLDLGRDRLAFILYLDHDFLVVCFRGHPDWSVRRSVRDRVGKKVRNRLRDPGRIAVVRVRDIEIVIEDDLAIRHRDTDLSTWIRVSFRSASGFAATLMPPPNRDFACSMMLSISSLIRCSGARIRTSTWRPRSVSGSLSSCRPPAPSAATGFPISFLRIATNSSGSSKACVRARPRVPGFQSFLRAEGRNGKKQRGGCCICSHSHRKFLLCVIRSYENRLPAGMFQPAHFRSALMG
jgi:hypothetical protein